jgi:hypothetical protein
MKKIIRIILLRVLSTIPLFAVQELVYAQNVDFGADSRYDISQDSHNGTYPGTGYDVYIKSSLIVNSLGSPLPANRASWRITSQGYFNIPNDLPLTFTSNGVTWTQTYYFYDPVDGNVSDVRYENSTPIPLDYEGSFIIKTKTARPTPGGAQVLIGWNTQVIAINGATDNQNANDSYDAPITVGTSPLPVTLTSFNATKEGQTALLLWTTTAETNSDRFEIQKSLNGKNWEGIGSVKSQGESNVLRKYTFADEAPSNGENLYRLKMIDNDASFGYSRIQSVTFEGVQQQALVYPNPASDVIKFNVADFSSVKSIKLYDLVGKTIFSANGEKLSKTVDVKTLLPGSYVVEIITNTGETKSTKIVIYR